MPEGVDTHIRACVDVCQLGAWLDRAVVAERVIDLFDWTERGSDPASSDCPCRWGVMGETVRSSGWLVCSAFAKEHFGRGRADGRAQSKAMAVLRVLALRGIEVPDQARARIRTRVRMWQLDRWLTLAIGASSVAELFD